jgi:hypothetical protein
MKQFAAGGGWPVMRLCGAAGGRPGEIVKDTSHGAGNQETYSKYAKGIRIKQYPRQKNGR